MGTLSEEETISILFCFSGRGFTLKGKNLLQGSKFFLFRVDPFQKGLNMQESK